ncbi:hypothetical protein [Soonwooa purpurea]
MKKIFTFLVITISLKTFAQNTDTIKFSDFKLCELTTDILKQNDPNLKQIKTEEMDLCSDGFVQDGRFENRIGYESKLLSGIIFQKYQSNLNTIAKIHLTKDFKGFLPNGKYIEVAKLKLKDVIGNSQDYKWRGRDCSDYMKISNDESLSYYVKINKTLEPRYPVDKKYYMEQQIEGIDIVSDCYSYYEKNQQKIKPLIILEGKEVSEESMHSVKPEDVDHINVIKDKNATDKYGEKGKNGVIEVFLKKKK